MSIKSIKSDLENYLSDNLTDIAIKWQNTNVYTKNGITLTDTEVNALDLYVEPLIIPIDIKKYTMGNVTNYKHKAFFQVSVFGKQNNGMGNIMDVADDTLALFREKIVDNIICESGELLASFSSGEWVILPSRILVHKFFI